MFCDFEYFSQWEILFCSVFWIAASRWQNIRDSCGVDPDIDWSAGTIRGQVRSPRRHCSNQTENKMAHTGYQLSVGCGGYPLWAERSPVFFASQRFSIQHFLVVKWESRRICQCCALCRLAQLNWWVAEQRLYVSVLALCRYALETYQLRHQEFGESDRLEVHRLVSLKLWLLTVS